VTSAQNAELCEHLKVFSGGNLQVKALLDAAAKDPDQREMYIDEIREESEVLALRGLVLPCPVLSSSVAKKLEESLARFGEGSDVRSLKTSGKSLLP
jgi:predicted butyrate kinase (DUF1464 family)